VAITYEWRGAFGDDELDALHAEAFQTRVFSAQEWDWRAQVEGHSLGWVLGRDAAALVGFVNVLWDGLVHPWIQDTMVAATARRRGIGARLVARATDGARAAGCEGLHVDFEDHLRGFYFGPCGFRPTNAGLIELQP
jgi:GNAT superfamily N-acetyltransferase